MPPRTGRVAANGGKCTLKSASDAQCSAIRGFEAEPPLPIYARCEAKEKWQPPIMSYCFYTPTAALLAVAYAILPLEGIMDAVVPLAYIGLSSWSMAVGIPPSLHVGVTLLFVASTTAPGIPPLARVPTPAGIAIAAALLQPTAWVLPLVLTSSVLAKQILWDRLL